MREPSEALRVARRRAAVRAAGGAEDPTPGLESPAVTMRQLVEWAIIEPDPAAVYSTRRAGRPITFAKRLLIRMLGQYLGQLSAQQSRFNAHMAAHVMRVEERVGTLEARVGRLEERIRAGRPQGAPVAGARGERRPADPDR